MSIRTQRTLIPLSSTQPVSPLTQILQPGDPEPAPQPPASSSSAPASTGPGLSLGLYVLVFVGGFAAVAAYKYLQQKSQDGGK